MSHRQIHRRHREIDMEPMDDSSDNSNQTWFQDGLNSMQLKRSEMNALIMDYLVHEGFKEAAERFKQEAGIEPVNLRFGTSCTENETIKNQQSKTSSQSNSSSGGCLSNNNSSSNNNNSNNNNNSISGGSSSCSNNSSNNSNNTSGKKEQQSQQKHPSSKNISQQQQQQDNVSQQKQPQPQQEEERLAGLDDWITKMETPEMLDKRIEIRHSIEEGHILKGQSLINLYYPEMLDNHRNLYFKLQQQHIIELIRQQKINEVLSFVHDQLSIDELRDLTEMEKTLALLAYENPDKSPYSSLLQPSHRLQLASEINDTILQETTGNVEPNKPRLVTLLKLLFWTQSELERKKIQFPKMTDLVNGTIVEPRH